jgi:hypothetical protein
LVVKACRLIERSEMRNETTALAGMSEWAILERSLGELACAGGALRTTS